LSRGIKAAQNVTQRVSELEGSGKKGGGGRGERKRGREGREARALGEYLNYGGRWERFNINLAL